MKKRKLDLSGYRVDYRKSSLSKDTIDTNPISQFELWMEEAIAANIHEPNAMVLSTISNTGTPTSRIVLLKEIIDNCFVFYTNYESEKAKHMSIHPNVSLNIPWIEIQRQVRIEGTVDKVSEEISRAYFKKRPRGSQIGAWVSPQSQIIQNRNFLSDRLNSYTSKFSNLEEIPMPSYWGGYAIKPMMIEFWQGRSNRLHDRIRYTKSDDEIWQIERIAP